MPPRNQMIGPFSRYTIYYIHTAYFTNYLPRQQRSLLTQIRLSRISLKQNYIIICLCKHFNGNLIENVSTMYKICGIRGKQVYRT